MSTYRFSWLRPSGWHRLGGLGAVAVLFGTPMMWSLGVFGSGDESLRLAGVFLMSGVWFFAALGYAAGWVVRGFVAKVKESSDDEDGRDSPPPARPQGRPAH